jgi:hypothetical protein
MDWICRLTALFSLRCIIPTNALATFSYKDGLLMSDIRKRAKGILTRWLAHIFTDLVIAGVILAIANSNR